MGAITDSHFTQRTRRTQRFTANVETEIYPASQTGFVRRLQLLP